MLAARDVTLRRGGQVVVDAAALAMREGQFTAICGPNGAGKSSLLGALAGLLPAAAGEVTLDGAPLVRLNATERARAIGYLPQQAEAAWDISVETLLGLGRLPWRGTASDVQNREAVVRALAAMQLEEFAGRALSTLSGGERARAMIGRVLAGEPRWILADEPLASLDLAHQKAVIALLADQARAGRGVVVVLHDLAAAMNHADRVVVLDRGRIAAEGPPGGALCEANIARVWQVAARWHGEPGAFALSMRQ